MTSKKLTPQFVRIFSSRIYPSLYDEKLKAQSVELAIMCLIADYCRRSRCNFKELSQDGGRANFSKQAGFLSKVMPALMKYST